MPITYQLVAGSFHYNSSNLDAKSNPYVLEFLCFLLCCGVFKANPKSIGIFLISFFVFEILRFKNLHFSTSGARAQSNFAL